jgi:hypothetical protein
MAAPNAGDLTEIELLVLDEAGGCNDLGCAYGVVQLYAVVEQEVELLDAVENALLRLFDLGLIRLVEATEDEGYRGDHAVLPAMSRDALKAELARERDPSDTRRDKMIFYDPTPAGEALLASVPRESIPRVDGTVRRPWEER